MNYYPQPQGYYQPQQVDISALVDQYALPYLLQFLDGKDEKQYHEFMRKRPDFIGHFQRTNKTAWTIVMGVLEYFRGRINLSPEWEARKVVHIIKRRGWKVYESEYHIFVDNIRRFLDYANG